MNLILLMVSVTLTVFIVFSCICRVNLLRPGAHAYSWTIKYALFTAFAGGEFLEATQSPEWFTWYELAGLVGIVMHLMTTRKGWRNGPPYVAEILNQNHLNKSTEKQS